MGVKNEKYVDIRCFLYFFINNRSLVGGHFPWMNSFLPRWNGPFYVKKFLISCWNSTVSDQNSNACRNTAMANTLIDFKQMFLTSQMVLGFTTTGIVCTSLEVIFVWSRLR